MPAVLTSRSLLAIACSLGMWFGSTTAVEPERVSTESEPAGGRAIDFNLEIRPLISNRCLVCHGPDEDERAAGLRLDNAAGSREDLGGYAAIVPGDPEASELLTRLMTDDEELRMPPAESGPRLQEGEIDLIRRWIAEGAEYANHWSYVAPRRPSLPEVDDREWPVGAIDRFILARLESTGLRPAAEADRMAYARRVSMDLIGLPPTWDQAQAFVDDHRDDAYERYVDRLLADPAFGERWARVWLDLARYADSAGYADDPPRTIWAYRDYVIRSLNENKPFDRFTLEQIAGDLLQSPTEEELIATAFHRNTLTNNEGGTNDEEFRNVAVVDRVNTTMAVWMGTTMACAQCHTHKYDPITQDEYFQFFAFFNNTEDSDKRDERPLLELWPDGGREQHTKLKRRVSELKAQAATLSERLADDRGSEVSEAEETEVVSQDSPGLAEEQPSGTAENERLRAERERVGKALERAEKELASFGPTTTVPILRELPDPERRDTHVQLRGNYLSKSQQVSEGTPAVFHPLPDDLPRDRYGLAHWLVADENPLTARVIANRHWEELFGTGIVLSSEEFGSQGDLPSHPQLLDWLAVELRDGGWDLKRLIRQIVLSATYRQSSLITSEMLEADPDNRLLSRGPRFRVSAEMVRDQALTAGDLLSHKMYGPPVQPPQPTMGLKAAFGSATDWTTSAGEDRYRRGIYTTWRRSNPYPSMATFDAPNREVCELRRGRTNTPLQALVTLNDPVYVEAARALARRMVESGDSKIERIHEGFRRTLIRDPDAEELQRLLQLVEATREQFSQQRELAKQLAVGEGEPIELATWTLVANVLLNLDEMLMKR